MSDYVVTISAVMDKCPFEPKRRSRTYCKVCNALNDPCNGLGETKTVVSKKIGKEKYMQILNIIK